MTQPLNGEQKNRLKAARGRGYQGDWVKKIYRSPPNKEHDEWNKQVEDRKHGRTPHTQPTA